MSGSTYYRRVIKLGNSYYVSLPRAWLEMHGLDKGSTITLEVVGKGLLIIKPASPKPYREPRVASVVAMRGWTREVIRAYLLGYEIIEISGVDDEDKRRLEDLLRLLVGLEVVEEKRGGVTLQCFIREDYDVKQVLARMDMLSRTMYIDAAKGLEEGDEGLLESVRRRDDKLDRLYFLAVRLLRGSTLAPPVSQYSRVFLVDARLVAKLLEEIGDEAERLTHAQPARRGLLGTAEMIARCQQAVIKKFLGGRHGKPVCLSMDRVPEIKGDAAWLSLRRIAGLVLDLAEVTY